jgi:ribosomal protein S18 acetylase RimI-like enzyme
MHMEWRESVSEADILAVRGLTEDTGYFTAEEIDIAVELVEERLRKGKASDYEFILLEPADRLAAYACYGRSPGTDSSWDLYWIVVSPGMQRRGVGSALLDRVEARIAESGGGLVWVDTSSTDKYAPTQTFYERAGFRRTAVLEDFYRAGDSKLIYVKRVPGMEA